MSHLLGSPRILVIPYFASWGSIPSRQAIGARIALQNRVAQFVHKLHGQQTACFPVSLNNAHQRKSFQEGRVPGCGGAPKTPVRPALFCRQCSLMLQVRQMVSPGHEGDGRDRRLHLTGGQNLPKPL